VNQRSSDFFSGTREESFSISTFSDFGYLDPFRRYSWSNSKVVWNRTEFCKFLAPDFFGGRAPEFLDLRYKAHPYCDHVSKSHSDRPREFGDLVAKKNKTRNMGLSQTWGRPAPQVQLLRQFWVVQIPLAATPPGESKWKVVWNRAEIPLGWVNMRVYNFFVCGPTFTIFFSPNVGGVVVDQLLFRFSTGRSVREIFAIKAESCLKSHRILASQISGGGPSAKIVPTWTPLPSGTSRGKVLVTLLPLQSQSYRRAHPEF